MARTMTRAEADREEFAGYVTAQLEAFRQHAGVHSFVWDAAKLTRARHLAPRDTSDAGAYVGAWHVVRAYVTTEFREWVEQYYANRQTFSEWRARAIAERAAAANERASYEMSAAYCTDQLEDLRALVERRDELIVSARERGATWNEIGAAIGLGRAQLHNIAAKHAATLRAAAVELSAGVPDEWEDFDPDAPF